MRKWLTAIFLLVLVALVLAVRAQANNDTCVNHKGREIWINHNAIPAHMAHGDTLCGNQNPDPTAIVPPENPGNPEDPEQPVAEYTVNLPFVAAYCVNVGWNHQICTEPGNH